MTPQEFAPYFAGFLPLILQKTVRALDNFSPLISLDCIIINLSQKKHCTIAEKSFSVGLLAVCMEPLNGVIEAFASHIYPVLTALMKDEDSEIRNNAVFGLGELVVYGKELMYT